MKLIQKNWKALEIWRKKYYRKLVVFTLFENLNIEGKKLIREDGEGVIKVVKVLQYSECLYLQMQGKVGQSCNFSG